MCRSLALRLVIGASVFGSTAAAAITLDEPAPSVVSTNLSAESTILADAAISDARSADPTGTEVIGTETYKNESTDDWDVAFTPYLWAAGVSGDVGVPRAGQGVEIDKSFSDILGSLKFAFMGALDVRHKRLVMISDIMYLSLGAEAEGIRDEAFVSGKVDASMLLASAALGYRIVDKGPLFVDIFAGGRVLALNVDMKLRGPTNTFMASKSPTNVAPMAGARVRFPLSDAWAVGLYGDVGGLVNSTDVRWQLLGTVQYDISRHWRAVVGYRHMSIHHNKNDLDFDVDLSGPILGVTYKF